MASTMLSAHEIRTIAGSAAAALLPIEVAVTLPVPLREKDAVIALFIYYSETGPRTNRIVHPPSHAMRIDASTGKIQHFGATTPERLGIVQPIVPVPGAGIDRAMTAAEFIQKRDRFLDISADVWAAFETGSTSVDATASATITEFVDLFLSITKAEVAPFYVGGASEFFMWIKAVTGRP